MESLGPCEQGCRAGKGKERESFKGAKTKTKLPFLCSALGLNVAFGLTPIWDFCTNEGFASMTPNSTRWRAGGSPGSQKERVLEMLGQLGN